MMPSIFGENLFDEFFDDDFPMIPMRSIRNPLYGKNAKNLMKTDVRETDNTYELDVDLPGFKKDEVQLDLKDGYLTISAAKGLDKDQEDISVYSTPEALWGYEHISSAYTIAPAESRELIYQQVRKNFPEAETLELDAVLG